MQTKLLKTRELAELLNVSTRHIYRHRNTTLKKARVSLGDALRWDPDRVIALLTEEVQDDDTA